MDVLVRTMTNAWRFGLSAGFDLSVQAGCISDTVHAADQLNLFMILPPSGNDLLMSPK